MFQPPDRQPPGKWVLKLSETGGTVRGDDFDAFLKAVNDQLASNKFPTLTPEQLLARMAAC